MPHLTALTGLALVAAAGGAVGTWLGRDTIARIDPIFFSELPQPSHFYAEDTPAGYTLGEPDPVPAEHLWWNAAPSSTCLNCPDNFVEPLYASAAVGFREDRPAASEQPFYERPIPERNIDRYSSFPVTEEEARSPVRSRLKDDLAERETAEPATSEVGAPPVGM
jgi:hypothetical protein